MSNHPSNNTKSRLLRRALAGVLTLALMLGLLPSSVFTARAASWADPYVQTLVDWGVMRGDIGGNMAPDRSITRAEFVTMMNRAYGYKKLGGHPFTDVRVRDWYNEDIDIAYNIGYFKGTGPTTASPNSSLTREQAAVLLARNMMLQETVGETLGFSDTRTLSDWSRGLVGAAAANGIIGGYEDGSFQPMRNITRGEVAAMLVRAIGTPIQSAGDHALGNVYGNVTVNTAGVKLRDGVIAGNLYLTGGIDLGDVLLENITVLGEIIVSGGGESNSSESSIILRNVVADSMVVDSIGDQFVTIRVEGITDIPTTTVRTNGYVDDSALPGYGLSHIVLDGDEGALYQLAGNIKDVVNKTPGSDLQIVQGSANKVTVDEEARDSSVLVDGDARVDDLNLDTATKVTGTGDIKNLNVGAAGSTVEQLPDNIVIRPGIEADIAGSNMNSTQGAESSAEPKLLAGYPAVRKIAPTSAELVFRTNKPGTIYWAVSSVADGSVSEADLLEPPTYGNKVLASGKITATAANTDYTAAVNRLTSAGSYYVTAMLVDGRGEHSPIKVTSFTTPDNSVPAFADGYPVMTLVTTEIAQVTVMTTKSCLLYYALLPKGAKAPTEAEFKSAAIPGNLGYGSQSVTKNVTIPINVNNVPLEEKTDYVLYLWLVDHDGAQKSAIVPLPFTTLDETPPVVTHAKQLFSNSTPGVDSIQVEYTIDEPADFVWAIVTEGQHMRKDFLAWAEENEEPGDADRATLKFSSEAELQAAKVQLASGQGALVSGTYTGNSPLTIRDAKLLFESAKTSSFVLYYIADDNATNTGNLSAEIKTLRVHTKDETPPDVSLRFSSDRAEVEKDPQADADVRIVFTEQVKGGNTPTNQNKHVLLKLYQDVLAAEEERENAESAEDQTKADNKINAAKTAMAKALETYIEFHQAAFPATNKLTPLQEGETPSPTGSWINWRNAEITMPPDGSGNLEILLPGVKANEAGVITEAARKNAGIQMEGGATYYFRFRDIYDLAYPTGNALVQGKNDPCYRQFATSFAKIELSELEILTIKNNIYDTDTEKYLEDEVAKNDAATVKNDPYRIDVSFLAHPVAVEQVAEGIYWDMLIWMNSSMTFTLYSREVNGATKGPWHREGTQEIIVNTVRDGSSYLGLNRMFRNVGTDLAKYEELKNLRDREYVIHIDSLDGNADPTTWNHTLKTRINFLAGSRKTLYDNLSSGIQRTYEAALGAGLTSIEDPDDFTITTPLKVLKPPTINSGYPSISISDTSAKVTLTMDTTGYVHYLALPITSMRDGNGTEIDNKTTTLTEAVIGTVGTYNTRLAPHESGVKAELKDVPRMVGGGATSSSVTGMTCSYPTRTEIFKTDPDKCPQGMSPADEAAGSGNEIYIDLDGLTPNTVYLLYLITESYSNDPASGIMQSAPLCFRFTTVNTDIPTIQLTGGSNPTIRATETTGKSAYISYFLVSKGHEGTGTEGDGTEFSKAFSTIAKDSFATDHPDLIAGGTKEMSVLAAMMESYRGSNGIYMGTYFDHYVKEEEKSTYEEIILSGSMSQGNNKYIVPGSPHRDEPLTRQGQSMIYDMKFGDLIDPGSKYTVIAMARRNLTSTQYAFSAWYDVEKIERRPPMLQRVEITNVKQKTDATDTSKIVGLASATVTMTFDQPLYNWVNGTTAVHIDNCGGSSDHGLNPSDASGTIPSCYSLFGGTSVNNSSIVIKYATKHGEGDWEAPITSISFTVTDPGTSPFSFNLDKYIITDTQGTGASRRTKFYITFSAINVGTADAPNWTLTAYGVSSEWANDGWDLSVPKQSGT